MKKIDALNAAVERENELLQSERAKSPKKTVLKLEKEKRGRPTYASIGRERRKKISVTLPPEIYEKAKKIACEKHVSVAVLVQQLIEGLD